MRPGSTVPERTVIIGFMDIMSKGPVVNIVPVEGQHDWRIAAARPAGGITMWSTQAMRGVPG